VSAFLPGAEQAVQGRQQQAHKVEDHGCVLAHAAIVTVEIGLRVEQEICDVHRHHQEQFTLAAIHGAVGATQQQDQGGKNIEQGCEEDAEVSYISRREPGQQQKQRRQEMARANSV